MIFAKQSTAIIVTVGPVLDASGVAVTDGVVGDFLISKNGGAPAALNGSATLTHRNTGHYSLSLTATDVNTLGSVEIVISDTVNACPIKEIMVLPANSYDSLVSGSGVGMRSDVQGWLGSAPAAVTVAGVPEVDVTHWLGTAAATPTVAGVPEVDVTHLGGGAQSATDLKDFADAGYDPATNKVEGVKLADTLTTYTGDTPQTGDSFVRLGAPAGASIAADLAAIEAQTDDIGVAGAGLTAITGKTDNLPTDPADESLIIAATDAIMTRLGAPAGASVSADVAAVKSDTAAILVDTGTTLDAALAAVDANVDAILADTGTDGVVVAAGSKTGYALSAAGVTAIWAEVVEGAVTAVQMMRGFAAALLGKASGLGTVTAVFRDTGDTKNRITATVDADGNRTAVVRDLT